MKKDMPLEGLRWSRDSGSALCVTPQTAVLGRAGGAIQTGVVNNLFRFFIQEGYGWFLSGCQYLRIFFSSQVFSVIDGLLSSPLCHKGV